MTLSLNQKFIRLKKEKRLHQASIPIIAITGGIATGKTSVSEYFRNKSLAVINADELIHRIYEKSDTRAFVQSLCPEAIVDNGSDSFINFKLLRERFFKDPHLKRSLEDHLYKRLPLEFNETIPEGVSAIFYDVPLLFEKGLDKLVDVILVVTASKEVQLSRLSSRDKSSSPETNENIINQQWPLPKKEEHADFVLNNNGTKKDLEDAAEKVFQQLFT